MKRMGKKGIFVTIIAVITALSAVVVISQKGNGCIGDKQGENKAEKQEATYQSLSAPDRETADLYAELYEKEREEVAKIQKQTKDWEKTGKKLEKEFFTIPENTKRQMAEEGYRLEDLEKAEELSVKTGRKAMDLAKEKGKASAGRKWSDVVREDEIYTTEEQLGLSGEQVKQLQKKSVKKEDRVEIAILLHNGTYTFGEILKALDDGKTVRELKKKTER